MTESSPSGRWLPFRIGLAIGLIAQFVFMLCYSVWAQNTYPDHNSMSGFAGLVYGFPVGLFAGCVGGAATNRYLKRPPVH